MFNPSFALMWTTGTFPPFISKETPAFSSYSSAFSGFAAYKSILLMATIKGTLSSFKILITYFVCCLTPSVADTMRITKSVKDAPLFLMLMNA